MNFKIVLTILRKELLETFRDKRTLIAMIFIPLVLYPALFIILSQVAIVQESKQEEKTSRVALDDPCMPLLADWIARIEKVELVAAPDPNAALRAGDVDAVVFSDEDLSGTLHQKGTATVRVEVDNTEESSRKARARLREGLSKQSQELLKNRLDEQGLEESFARPLQIQIRDIAPPEKTTGFVLGQILPMILVIMVAVGAFYPAVDLTAGEKERGTFETLLSTPTSKTEIVCGKFLTSFILAMLVAFLNLASMSLTVLFQLSQFASEFGMGGKSLSLDSITPDKIILIFIVLVPLAFFVCSVMMSLAIFARSYKEAQNYVSPFYILIMIPAMMANMPGMEINQTTQFIPIANVALLFKSLLKEAVAWDLYFGVFLSTAVFAMLALVVAVWLFQREDVILSEEKGIPFTIDRSAFQPRRHLTFGMALMLFGVGLLLLFYGGTYFQSRDPLTGMFITQWALLFAPVILLLWFIKVDLRSALRLRPPKPAAVLAVFPIAAGMIVVISQIMQWQNIILPMPHELIEQMEEMLQIGEEGVSLWLALLAFALSPAICEEIVFRGAILSGVRSKFGLLTSAVIVGCLFGLFHLSVYRILPTALLGIMMTYLVLRSRSIYIGMLAHLLHNGTLILIATGTFPEPVMQQLTLLDADMPLKWFIIACAMVLVGIVMMEWFGKEETQERR